MDFTKTTKYPLFVTGQVLRSNQLNMMREYMESENNQSNAFLLGCGIFYGLIPSYEGDVIRVSPGAGVSSDGFLFVFEQEQEFRYYTTETKRLGKEGISCTAFVISKENKNEANDIARTPLPANDQGIKDKVLVVFINEFDVSRESCLESYENSAGERTKQMEVLLIDKACMDKIRGSWLNNAAPPELLTSQPFIHRFGYQEKENKINFDVFTDWGKVRSNFATVCSSALETLSKAYIEAYEKLKSLLKPEAQTAPFSMMKETLQALLKTITESGVRKDYLLPYYYDYLKDLMLAYKELQGTPLFQQITAFPDTTAFPRYISLGEVDKGQPEYRMALYRPPITDINKSGVEKVKLLLWRLKVLYEAGVVFFNDLKLPDGAGITPCATRREWLSNRCIPFYYTAKEELIKYWSFESVVAKIEVPGTSDERDQQLWMEDMDKYNFFHIKGHVGKTVKDAEIVLKTLRKDCHLPFDIKLVFLDEDDIFLPHYLNDAECWFEDLSLLLQGIVSNINCHKLCNGRYMEVVFKSVDITDKFLLLTALVEFFKEAPSQETEIESWIAEQCKIICGDTANKEEGCIDGMPCCQQYTRALYNIFMSFRERKEAYLSQLLFHRFAASHPGLEHNAGVPKGGTLVLVAAPDYIDGGKTKETVKSLLQNRGVLKENESGYESVMKMLRASQLSEAIIVADFCLPYQCCSHAPNVKIEFRETPPIAIFSEKSRTPILKGESKELIGYKVALENHSLYAIKYKWELMDTTGTVLETFEDKDISLKLLFEKGVAYHVKLTARRDPLSATDEQELFICPDLGDVALDWDGQSSFDGIITDDDAAIINLNYAPEGGKLILRDNAGQEINTAGRIKWENQSLLFNYSKLKEGSYELSYGFEACDNSVVFRINLHPMEKEEPKTAEEAGISPTIFKERQDQYKEELAKISDRKGLKDTKELNKGMLCMGHSIKMNTRHKRYDALLQLLEKPAAAITKTRKQLLLQLLAVCTAAYLDALINESPDNVITEGSDALTRANTLATADPENTISLTDKWDTTEIKNGITKTTIDKYKKLVG